MKRILRMNRITMLALLVGLVAGTAYGQSQPYSGPPGSRDPNDSYWRQPTGPYDPQPDYGYDRDRAPDIDVGFFYDELSPYGEWVRHPQYGWVWFPRHVQARWRPYSLGRWVESDYGWTWVSDEPFGWATYHYGRWAWDPQIGWLWVPGTVWGPAWVAWQQGNGYVGWAPLPPAVGFEIGVGIRLGGFNLTVGIAPRDYAFVEERRFLDSRIGGYVVPTARNVTIINHTTNVTNYTVVNDRVINHGVPIERIERATGRRAPRLRVATATTPRGAGVQRDVINIYRPRENMLETVRVARRNNAGLPQAAPPPNRPAAQSPTASPPVVPPIRRGAAPVPIPVAPRTKPAPRDNDERQFRREQQELKASQDKQQRALEQIHRQEMAKAKAKADAQEVAQRHAAELKAQQELRQRAEQQLQTRQQIERQAAKASAAEANKSRKPPAKKPNKAKEEKRKHNEQKPPQPS
jgi:hypothetical protein